MKATALLGDSRWRRPERLRRNSEIARREVSSCSFTGTGRAAKRRERRTLKPLQDWLPGIFDGAGQRKGLHARDGQPPSWLQQQSRPDAAREHKVTDEQLAD